MNGQQICKFALTGAVLIFSSLWFPAVSAQQASETPETVLVTYHAKPGSEAQLASAIAKQWKTARDLKLVSEAPHVVVRGSEDGDKTYFVEIFTWRDGGIPDAAPAAIRAIWTEMNSLAEPRDGKSGIDVATVSFSAS